MNGWQRKNKQNIKGLEHLKHQRSRNTQLKALCSFKASCSFKWMLLFCLGHPKVTSSSTFSATKYLPRKFTNYSMLTRLINLKQYSVRNAQHAILQSPTHALPLNSFSIYRIYYLSGNWKTMPTFSGVKDWGAPFNVPLSVYLCTHTEPAVGLVSPARSWCQQKQTQQNKHRWEKHNSTKWRKQARDL